LGKGEKSLKEEFAGRQTALQKFKWIGKQP
jgi:hypothetical protein